MRIMFIGDIVGKYGLEYLKAKLPQLRNDYKPNIIIVNAINGSRNIYYFTIYCIR